MDIMVPWTRRGDDRGRSGNAVGHGLGLALSAFIVGMALLGPPATGQSAPAVLAIRHYVTMLDRELETVSARSKRAIPPSSMIVDAAKPGPESI
jgi:hypothetical protein